MTEQEWHERYVERLVKKGDFTYREARGILKDRMGQHDYNDSPEDAADEELNYWRKDG